MPVLIIDDDVLEMFVESFWGNLAMGPAGIPSSVVLYPIEARTNIVDNDGMYDCMLLSFEQLSQ